MDSNGSISMVITKPEWSYFHLELIPSTSKVQPVDLITWKTLLNKSLSQYLGIMGQSIHVDMIHQLDPDTANPSQRAQLWIRVPQPDAVKVRSALSGFSSSMDSFNGHKDEIFLRVVRASEYLIGVTGPRRSNPGF